MKPRLILNSELVDAVLYYGNWDRAALRKMLDYRIKVERLDAILNMTVDATAGERRLIAEALGRPESDLWEPDDEDAIATP